MSRGGTNREGNPAVYERVEGQLDRLQGILEQQLERMHQGRLTAVEELGERATECVKAIRANHVPGSHRLAQRRRRLQELYEQLCLALTAERAETSERLAAVRRGKKVLRAYGNRTL